MVHGTIAQQDILAKLPQVGLTVCYCCDSTSSTYPKQKKKHLAKTTKYIVDAKRSFRFTMHTQGFIPNKGFQPTHRSKMIAVSADPVIVTLYPAVSLRHSHQVVLVAPWSYPVAIDADQSLHDPLFRVEGIPVYNKSTAVQSPACNHVTKISIPTSLG